MNAGLYRGMWRYTYFHMCIYDIHIYIYMYIHIHICICMDIYIYIHKCAWATAIRGVYMIWHMGLCRNV